MIKNHWNSFLRAEATEHENAGGGAVATAVENASAGAQASETARDEALPRDATATACGETPQPQAQVQAQARAQEPTRMEKIRASMRDKGALLAERDGALAKVVDLEAAVGTLKASVAEKDAEIGRLRGELAAKSGELEAIDAELATARGEKQTVDAAAARQVAQMGFEAADLPEAKREEESREALEARLAKTTDEKERWELATRINAMD